MTQAHTFLEIPTARDSKLYETFQPLFDKVAEGNAERENERRFPFEQVRWLRDARLGSLRVPVARGGFGASLRQTFSLLADLAAADPNVAHVWRNHLAFVEDRLYAAVTPDNEVWLERILAGEFVGGGWTEANNGTLDDMKTRITQADGGWQITGAKFYATGSLYADWLDVLGVGPDGSPLTALVRVAQPGVELLDDWDGFGQRTTASGSANYLGARIEPGALIPLAERNPYLVPFYQVAILAVMTGILGATLTDGIDALKARKRNYRHGLDPVPARDPQLLQVLGRVSALSFAARAALDRASSSLDAVAALRVAGAERPEHLRDALVGANVATSQAQIVIIDAALEGTTIVFDALGASGTSQRLRLDRHWRNARTLASHNPRIYKERVIGDWAVHGTDPLSALSGLPVNVQGS